MSEDLNETIGVSVRHHRERLGLSQTALSNRMRALGLSWHQMTVGRTESGERPLRLDEATALAGCLDVPVMELLRPPHTGPDELQRLADDLARAERALDRARKDEAEAAIRLAFCEQSAADAEAALQAAQQRHEETVSLRDFGVHEHRQAAERVERCAAKAAQLRSRLDRQRGYWAAVEYMKSMPAAHLGGFLDMGGQ